MNYTRSQKKKYDSMLEASTANFLSNVKQELSANTNTTSTNQEHSSKDDDLKDSISSSSNLEKCPICLQKFNLKSKSYTSKCFHSYCFECLLEWTKIRYNCPLCKQAFDRIIYDVRSNLEYKEYLLKPKEDDSLNYPLEIIAYLPPPNFSNNFNPELSSNNPHSLANVEPIRSKASWILNRESSPVEFRMLVYKNGWYVSPHQIQIEIKVTNVELEISENPNENQTSTVRNVDSLSNAMSLKTTLYKHVNRFRQASPQWFRNNPAVCHRLHNFLFRELHALSSLKKIENSLITKSNLSQKIFDLLKEVYTDSEEFLEEISPYIRPIKYARHFSHELTAYIKSASHDLFDYDAKCVYYPEKKDIPEKCLTNYNEIFPFKSLPLNLSKYRLEFKENMQMKNSTRNVNIFIEDNDDNGEEDHEVIAIMNPESLIALNANSDDEDSSFCEEVTPPRKLTPECIVLSASTSCSSCSSEESDNQNVAKNSESSHLSKSNKREHARSSRRKHKRHSSKKSSKKKSHEKSSRSKSHKKSKKRRKKEVKTKDKISSDEKTE